VDDGNEHGEALDVCYWHKADQLHRPSNVSF
jgi:hypothetical protein